MLAAKLKNARAQDILDANKVVKKIKSETVKLKISTSWHNREHQTGCI